MMESAPESGYTVVINGHPMFNAGFAWLVDGTSDLRLAATGHTVDDAIRQIDEHRPDVVVVDGDPREPSRVASLLSRARLLIIADVSDVETPVSSGLHQPWGWLTRSASPREILSAIRSIACGSTVFGAGVAEQIASRLARRPRTVFPALTDREHDVLELAAQGMTNMDISRRLSVAVKTVRNHMSNVLMKLRVARRAEAVDLAKRAGLGAAVSPPSAGRVEVPVRALPPRTPRPARSLPPTPTAPESATMR